jgi:demethylmenaquinone methyltransferase/2-methoxy-6-polyprenyl-1,4-benzoquinol methylase
MAAYYRARAAEYDEWFYRKGRYDRGDATNRRWFQEAAIVFQALDNLEPKGDVLELAPGTGIWTERLLRHASSITALDASEEMIAINKEKTHSDRIEYEIADLFTWQPDRRYDVVCFSFWISHVPRERLDAFLRTVASALKPGGKVFFVDGRREQTSTAVDHVLPEAMEQVMTRRLNDGREFQIVKNFYDPAMLAAQCAAAGLDVAVRETPNFFLYGVGSKHGDASIIQPYQDLVRRLQAIPSRIEQAVANLGAEQFHTRPAPDAWSPLEVLGHVRASADIIGQRCYAVLARDTPVMPSYDERRWAEIAGYADDAWDSILAGFRTQRRDLVRTLERTAPAEWDRTGLHDVRGPQSLLLIVTHMVEHEEEHCRQLEVIARAFKP